MFSVVRVLSIPAVAVSLAVGAAPAQAQRPMRLVDLLNVPRLTDPQLSPDARHVLFVREDADWSADRRIGHIYRINADGSGLTQMTQGEGEASPRWSPDGKTIAFLARRNGDDVRRIYLLPAGGGEARQLTEHTTTVSDISWTPDGRWIYFTAADDESPEEKARKKAKDDVYVFDESYEHEHLWRVAVADSTETRLTEGTFSVLSYELSRDATKIVYHRAPSPLVGDADRGEVWIADADGRNALQLTRNIVSETNATLSPDNQHVLFTSNSNERFTFYYNANLFIVPAAGGDARMLTGDFPYEVGNASWAKDSQSVFLVANMGVHSELVELDVATRRTRNLTNGDHAVNGWTPPPQNLWVGDQ